MSAETAEGFTGQCSCGAVRYRIRRKYLNAVHCHCDMCRKLHGSAFATYAFAMPNQIDWEGEENLSLYPSSETGTREFCRNCGSIMRAIGQAGNGQVEVPAGSLHGNPKLSIFGHIFAADRPDWDVINDAYPQYPCLPDGYGAKSSRKANGETS